MNELNILDWLLIGAFGVSALLGLLRGFTREIISLIGWGVAIVLALGLSKPLSALLEQKIPNVLASEWVVFAFIFIIVLLITAIVGRLLSKAVKLSPLSVLDRVLGGLLGLIRGGVILAVVVHLLALTNFSDTYWWASSHLVLPLQEHAQILENLLRNLLT